MGSGEGPTGARSRRSARGAGPGGASTAVLRDLSTVGGGDRELPRRARDGREHDREASQELADPENDHGRWPEA